MAGAVPAVPPFSTWTCRAYREREQQEQGSQPRHPSPPPRKTGVRPYSPSHRVLHILRKPPQPPACQPQRPWRARSAEARRLGDWEARRDEYGPLHRSGWEGDVCHNKFDVTVQCGACLQTDNVIKVKKGNVFRSDFGLSTINTIACGLCKVHGLSADKADGATIQYTYSCQSLRFAWDSSLSAPAFLFFERSTTADITVTAWDSSVSTPAFLFFKQDATAGITVRAEMVRNVHRFSLSHGPLKQYCEQPYVQMLQLPDVQPPQRPPLQSLGRKGILLTWG